MKRGLDKFGQAVPNVFSNRYIQMCDLVESALSGGPEVTLSRIGENRASYATLTVKQVLKQ